MDPGRQSVYLHDFETRIRDVDAHISAKAGQAPSLIFTYTEKPDEAGAYHVLDLASYYPKLKVAPQGLPDQPKKTGRAVLYFSAYLIYAPMVIRFVERSLERTTFAGYGDQAINEFWSILAVTLVRFRVIAHKKLFPGVKLRTKEDMVKHRLLFAGNNNEIEGLRNIESCHAKLTEKEKSDVHNVDTFWTLQLVAHALESGSTLEEAIEYIAMR